MTRRVLQRGSEFSHASAASANDGTEAFVSTGAACAIGLAAFVAALASFSAIADPGDIVVLRSVEPRIAYRGIPQGDMPIAAAVEPFPSARFQQSTAAVASDLTDSDLAAAVGRSAAGAAVSGTSQSTTGRLALAPSQIEGLANGSGAGSVSGGIAAQVAQATGNMTGALMHGLVPLAVGGRP
ncbi:hypothetical protein [Cupriavidus basilensis]|uniref:Uncharacterized protein n=1 Tax=Cupriavidus basilensis TaxID=68895 RepID=A0A0C4YPV2_9BURK|nr:hypothetical protein [Cupriavidus basilensis]AJG25068.1 hypothetical protein RR42_s3492 [Cupriavidus basilensis]